MTQTTPPPNTEIQEEAIQEKVTQGELLVCDHEWSAMIGFPPAVAWTNRPCSTRQFTARFPIVALRARPKEAPSAFLR